MKTRLSVRSHELLRFSIRSGITVVLAPVGSKKWWRWSPATGPLEKRETALDRFWTKLRLISEARKTNIQHFGGNSSHVNVLKSTFSTDCKSNCIRIGLTNKSQIAFFLDSSKGRVVRKRALSLRKAAPTAIYWYETKGLTLANCWLLVEFRGGNMTDHVTGQVQAQVKPFSTALQRNIHRTLIKVLPHQNSRKKTQWQLLSWWRARRSRVFVCGAAAAVLGNLSVLAHSVTAPSNVPALRIDDSAVTKFMLRLSPKKLLYVSYIRVYVVTYQHMYLECTQTAPSHYLHQTLRKYIVFISLRRPFLRLRRPTLEPVAPVD